MRFRFQIGRFAKQAVLFATLTIPVSGCVAAAPAIMMAASGAAVATSVFGGYKVYQSVSGGEIGVEFRDEVIAPAAQSGLADARSIAFWRSPDWSLVEAAERAEVEFGDLDILSPSAVSARLQAAGISTDLAQMTRRERAGRFEEASALLGVDLLVGLRKLGVDQQTNMFSLSRPTLTQNYEVILYSPAHGDLWTANLAAIVGIGGGLPSDREVEAIVGEAIVDRLKDIEAGRAQLETQASLLSNHPVCTHQGALGCVR